VGIMQKAPSHSTAAVPFDEAWNQRLALPY
jgi:hypothetical protein